MIALANRLEHDEQHAAKLAAAMSLTRFGEEGKPAINALISGINDTGSWQIRKASILALRRIGGDKKDGPNPRATDSLSIIALHDPAFEVRIEAIQAIGYMDKPRDHSRLRSGTWRTEAFDQRQREQQRERQDPRHVGARQHDGAH